MLTVGVLGPLEVTVGDRPVELTSPTLRTMLVVLAMTANSPVPVDRLAAALWTADRPEHVRRTVQSHLTRLRTALDADVIATEPTGYRLRVDPDRVDALRFTRLINLAAQAPDAANERRQLEAALALWRGNPFEDTRSEWLEHLAHRLVEQYLTAVERRVDLDLIDGRHGDVMISLEELTAAHPLRETLWARLLTALARSGRQAEALSRYESVRRRFADELGTDPGPELQQIHADLLAALPPDAAPRPPTVARVTAPVPRQLPADADGFTGRAAELKMLQELVDDHRRQTTSVLISAISGMAGVGKTTLAVHWAHTVADRFPDGQLYYDLRGFHGSGQAVPPTEAVRHFLDAMGVPPSEIPSDPDARMGLYRSVLFDRRMLIVLDNARDAEQVRPLLPGSPTCVVLVTSRDRLTGLAATEAAQLLMLDVLPGDEARELLAARLGRRRIADEADATDRIVARCAGLPLALTVTAARVAAYSLSLATVADQLANALDTLETGDPVADARVVFSWSYRTLTPAAARLFRLLGLHTAPDISAAAAASLTGVAPARVHPHLAELLRAHLLTEPVPGRFTMHDLLRAYATELALTHDDDVERRTATHRLLDHYLHTACAAARALNPLREQISTAPPLPGVTPEQPTDVDQALAWYTAEHATLLAAVRQAAATRFDTHTWQLAWAAVDYQYRGGHWHEWLDTQHAALEAARRLSDRSAEAKSCGYLGMAYAQMGSHTEADPYLRTALELYRQLDDPRGQAQTHLNLGAHLSRQERYAEALEHCQQALDLFVAAGDRPRQAQALNAIGWYHAQLGNHREALSHCRRALALQQELGDRTGEASTWDSIGYALHRLGEHQEAIDCYQHAIDLYKQLGIRYYPAVALTHQGDAHSAIGDLQTARSAWQSALDLLEDLDHPEADRIRAKLESAVPER